ncbi:MAG: glycosyltransferase family 2 protein [Xanthomonadaceae bacterium]|nr:glycosyltransferase family 2 protein [Xanthomonadaceae bacterium]
MNDIVAIVVTYRSESTIDECLQRLRAAQGIAQIRVIDNGSKDATIAIVQRHAVSDSRVRFIANPDNPGFAVACNQGAAESDAPWLAFINPDLLVEPDALLRLRRHQQDLGEDVLLGADLVDETGVRDTAARRCDPEFAAMLHSPGKTTQLGIALDAARSVQMVDAISGALMLVSREWFLRAGGFDEGYRLHAEDLDLCRRVRLAGGRVAVANDVSVVHLRGISSRSRPVFVEYHKHRGLWRYFSKFEAAQCGSLTRIGVWMAIWAHFHVAVLKRLLRRA